ncbi:hypothetical protein E2P65_04400 [Candidatus Bathyarchaeota archaeon]|nr:hypothetical protein E2P65_04400 [Candidatus Bathyarchaeota archaeon]
MEGRLRLLVYTDGDYGLRILENIRLRGPRGWEVAHVSIPEALPPVVEEPELLVDGLVPEGGWDLVLFMGESPSAFSLLPSIATRSHVGAVIAPVDDYSWLPLGLERQLRSELDELGVASVFPRTFCTLSPVGVAPIDEFVTAFGLPHLKIEEEGGRVKAVEVLRGAPCGSTWFMAGKLVGVGKGEAGAKAGTFVQIYPCLASRHVERLLGDAPIHIAGHIAEKAVKRALRGKD